MNLSIDYIKLPEQHSIKTPEDLYQLFWDRVAWDWHDAYEQKFPKHGEVTLQHFYRFGFIIDHVWDYLDDPELPENGSMDLFVSK